MKIYVSHSRAFDFINDLYKPLKEANFPVEFIFPHEDESDPYDSKLLLERHGCEYVLAEVSLPTTGQGIELGWADIYKIPIICFYKKGTQPSGSLSVVTEKVTEYSDRTDLINKLTTELGLNIP